MSTQLSNHPQHWLRDDAARAFDRVEAAHGRFTVTSAGRTIAEQQRLIDRWWQGGVYNRPPYLYEPARPPETSAHVRDGGVAVDVAEWQRFKDVAKDHGFVQSFLWDVVHFEYIPGRDNHRFDEVIESTLKGYGMETIILREDGTVFHITPVKAYAFKDVGDYNAYRKVIRASGISTSMLKPPAITSLKKMPAWRVKAIADRVGVTLPK